MALFEQAGIRGVDSFMKSDRNFSQAANLQPHVTIYKGVQGRLPTAPLGRMSFNAMNIISNV
jgi:hypothetical protein